MIYVFLIKETFRLEDNSLLANINESTNNVVFVYIIEKNISRLQLNFKLDAFYSLINSLKNNNIFGYIYEKNNNTIYNHLKDALKENFEIIEDNKKVFLFPSITKEYKIFTPFFNYNLKYNSVPLYNKKISDIKINSIKINHKKFINIKDYTIEKNNYFPACEQEAQKRWAFFKKNILHQYEKKRDFLDNQYTSILSPYINCGQISVRQLWHESISEIGFEKAKKFLTELAWRDFAYHIYQFNPNMIKWNINKNIIIENISAEKDTFSYYFDSWKEGKTGYSIIDAGMNELRKTGWMPNRLRMLVASFLTKNLLISWQNGAAYFMEKLIDGDTIINAMNWQWVAGTGIDNNPYFRIFNPIIQARKFDSNETYQNKWSDKNNKSPIVDFAASGKKYLLAYKKLQK